ncbi:restriction endonuclease subunit S [Faecalibacterium prausnitzii]|uniref:Restriction endonuclease subunit S n=1 Tax=Faecalibacterium prausnitzii TaxID=853 RepID=A0A3E2U6L5_9FIRM|nr:restriction endonuclease subunit S [Faecalibacterium prausnitzii]RGB91864.1 restriction endonuclease subunit S [Faecalibacterium prausnitzii]
MAKLGEVCLLKAGKFVSANDISPEYNKGLYPCFGGNGIRGYVADYTHDGEFPLIGRQGALCGNVNLASGKFHATEHAVVVQPKIEMNVHWLYYALNAMNLGQYATGAAQPGLAVSKLETLSIEIPNISEQNKIAQTLYKVEQLVNFRKQQLAKLDELVKARFVEMFGDPVRNEKGWNTYALAEMCDGIGDGLHGTPEYDENGEYPFINGNNLIDGVIQINASTKKVNKKTYEKHYIKISQNAILLSINGTLGKIAFYNGEQVMLGKSACYCNLKDEVNRIFVYKIMKTDAFAGYLEDNSTKSTIKNVGLKAIREYRLIAPPLSLQNQFAVFAEYVDQQKQTVQQSLEKLELMKKALMQEYFG